MTNALGHVTTVETYDPHGRPTRVLDPNGVATEHTYDQRGRVTETQVAAGTPDEAVTGYDYDFNSGNLQFLTAPNGVVTEYRYDANNQLTHIIDGAGQQWTVWQRNTRGEILEIHLLEADETLTFKHRREFRAYSLDPIPNLGTPIKIATTVESSTTTVADQISYLLHGSVDALTAETPKREDRPTPALYSGLIGQRRFIP